MSRRNLWDNEEIKDNSNERSSRITSSTTLSLSQEIFRITIVVILYFFISISLVFLNKNIMSSDFSFPLFITWYQLVVALFCICLLGEIGKSVRSLALIPPFEFDYNVAKKVLPLSIVFVCMISFNNLCLFYVEVTFYQVVRALTICFSIIFTYFILHQETSFSAIRASGVVVLGFIIGSIGEVHFEWLGVLFGVISSVFVALYSIYVKKIMNAVDNDQWRLLIYNTTISIILMLPTIIFSNEFTRLKESDLLWDAGNWIAMTMTGIIGFLMNIAVFLQIKFTSPLTNNISGTLKACLQTLLAYFVYKNPISFLNGVGIFLVIFGSFWYSNVRYSEMIAEKAIILPLQSQVSTPLMIKNSNSKLGD